MSRMFHVTSRPQPEVDLSDASRIAGKAETEVDGVFLAENSQACIHN